MSSTIDFKRYVERQIETRLVKVYFEGKEYIFRPEMHARCYFDRETQELVFVDKLGGITIFHGNYMVVA